MAHIITTGLYISIICENVWTNGSSYKILSEFLFELNSAFFQSIFPQLDYRNCKM